MSIPAQPVCLAPKRKRPDQFTISGPHISNALSQKNIAMLLLLMTLEPAPKIPLPRLHFPRAINNTDKPPRCCFDHPFSAFPRFRSDAVEQTNLMKARALVLTRRNVQKYCSARWESVLEIMRYEIVGSANPNAYGGKLYSALSDRRMSKTPIILRTSVIT